MGQLAEGQPLFRDFRILTEFRKFVRREWQTSIDLLNEARTRQSKRRNL
ncbi:MAG: hypothetical protein ACPGVU_11865 [Limisphaerales bacterium]